MESTQQDISIRGNKPLVHFSLSNWFKYYREVKFLEKGLFAKMDTDMTNKKQRLRPGNGN